MPSKAKTQQDRTQTARHDYQRARRFYINEPTTTRAAWDYMNTHDDAAHIVASLRGA